MSLQSFSLSYNVILESWQSFPSLPLSLLCCSLARPGLSPRHLGGQDTEESLICPAKGVTGQNLRQPNALHYPLAQTVGENGSCHFSAFLQDLTCSEGARGKAVPACTGT